MSDQQCPICSSPVTANQRYPDYVCDSCQQRMVDADLNPIRFYNTDISGGLEPDERAFIDGKEVYASEAHFGGVVIRLKK